MLGDVQLDEVDVRILQSLVEDSTRSHKEIGLFVHLTGQAVGARVRKLEDQGVIEGYTVRWSPERTGLSVHALLVTFMKLDASHARFQAFLKQHEHVDEVHRVSGEGCYWLRVRVRSMPELSSFLDELLNYCNYKLSLSIERIK